MAGNVLILRFLGESEVVRDGAAVPLPPSKKTRALLAYLAVAGGRHRRERLCSLLWDVADDPRGALRWSLSKLRAIVDEPGRERIAADRESVSFSAHGSRVDLLAIRERIAGGVNAIPIEDLEALGADGRRMLCVFVAPDAESVRIANRESGATFDRAWTPTLHEPAPPA